MCILCMCVLMCETCSSDPAGGPVSAVLHHMLNHSLAPLLPPFSVYESEVVSLPKPPSASHCPSQHSAFLHVHTQRIILFVLSEDFLSYILFTDAIRITMVTNRALLFYYYLLLLCCWDAPISEQQPNRDTTDKRLSSLSTWVFRGQQNTESSFMLILDQTLGPEKRLMMPFNQSPPVKNSTYA